MIPRAALMFTVAVATLLGCAAGFAHDSAPEIGCAPEQVTIDQVDAPWEGPRSWRATCEGKRWFCSQAHERVICTEDPRPDPPEEK